MDPVLIIGREELMIRIRILSMYLTQGNETIDIKDCTHSAKHYKKLLTAKRYNKTNAVNNIHVKENKHNDDSETLKLYVQNEVSITLVMK